MSYNKLRNFIEDLEIRTEILETGGGDIGGAPTPGSVLLMSETTNTIYNTINSALASASTGDTLLIGPGTYAETLDIPPGVIVKGYSAPRDVIIAGSSSEGRKVSLSPGSTFREALVTTPTGNFPAIYFSGSQPEHTAIVLDIFMVGTTTTGQGFLKEGKGRLLCRDMNFATGSVGKFMVCNEGGILLQDGNFLNGHAEELFVQNGGEFDVRSFQCVTGSIGTGISISGSGDFLGHELTFSRIPDIGVHFSVESSSLDLSRCNLEGKSLDLLFDPELTGVGTTLIAHASKFRLEKLSVGTDLPNNASISTLFFDEGEQDDKTVRFGSEVSIGTTLIPRELAVGEGDSTTVGMFCFASSSSGFVDNTADAKSSQSGSFNIFSSNASGSSFYIGNPRRKFPGFKSDLVSTISGSSGIWEYWNGSGWTEFSVLTTDSNWPYGSYANKNFSGSLSHHVRFADINENWESGSVNSINAYWVRHSLTTAITATPVGQRFKLHTNSFQVNEDGILEFFGRARPTKELVWHKNLEDDLAGSSPANQTINFSPNIDITPRDNNFSSTVEDGNGGIIEIPEGLDTSLPIVFDIYWYANANGSPSSVEIEFESTQVKLGDVINGGLNSDLQNSIETIGTSDNKVLRKTEFIVDVSTLKPGEFLAFSYLRNADASNLDDDFGSSIIIVKTSWKGTFWK